MSFITLLEINPALSSLFGLLVLSVNYIFSFLISCKYKIINNYKLNFIFFNIVIYLAISVILLFLLLLKIDILNIRILFYLLFVFKIISILFFYKNLTKESFNFFKKYDYLILLIFILYCFSPISDADSLDYHLGGVLDIIKNQEFKLRTDEWHHFRLISLGEMINFYGLLFYSLNFGQLFQILAISNILIIFSILNNNYKINYLVLLSFPLFASLLLSAKQLLIVSNCYLIIFSIILIKDKLLNYTIFALLLLTLSPLGFKHSYLIYSLPIWIVIFINYRNQINFFKYLYLSFLIFLLIPFIFYFKNFLYYGDPITPFLEFVKINPDLKVLDFANELRYSSKIFNIVEFPVVPIIHSLPFALSEITLLTSPILFFSYYIVYKIKDNKVVFVYICIVFILLFFSGKSQSRYFLDLYLLCAIIFLININHYKNKIISKLIIISMLPYAFLTLLMIFYGVYSLSLPTLDEVKLTKNMNEKSHNYEIINWINSEVTSDDLVLYYRSIRSKSYQNHNFLFYNQSEFTLDDFRKITKNNNVTKIVLTNGSSRELIDSVKNCKYLEKKKFNLRNTRNPFNKKSMDYIYLIDSRCIL